MAFDVAQFKANPLVYMGTKKFMAPGLTGSVADADIMTSDRLPNVPDMQIKTISNQTSVKHFNVAGDTTYTATVTPAGGAFQAYWLPWKTGHAFKIRLGGRLDIFITAKMNACGIIIGGPRDAPVIIHANTNDVTQPIYDAAIDIGVLMERARKQQTIEYKKSYGSLAAQAVAANYFGSGNQNVCVLDPEFYLSNQLQSMSVFGIRSGAQWTFYANLHAQEKGKTMEIWPNQPGRLPTV